MHKEFALVAYITKDKECWVMNLIENFLELFPIVSGTMLIISIICFSLVMVIDKVIESVQNKYMSKILNTFSRYILYLVFFFWILYLVNAAICLLIMCLDRLSLAYQ